MFKKIPLHAVKNHGLGQFHPTKLFSQRICNDNILSEVIVETGVAYIRDATYSREFIVFSRNNVIFDLNNYTIMLKKYGKNYWDTTIELSGEDLPESVRGHNNNNKYVLIGGMKNIWHWLNNFLPRVILAKQHLKQSFSEHYFIFHDEILDVQLQHLYALGLTDQQIIRESSLCGVMFSELIVPSFLSNLFFIPELSTAYQNSLQDYFGKKDCSVDRNFVGSEKIYLSRQRSRARRVSNQGELDEVLKKHRFVTVYAEELNAAEQFKVFNGAKIIVSPHGAGISNINFCRPGTNVIIFEYKKSKSEMKALAQAYKLNPMVLICEQVDNGSPEKRLFDLKVPCLLLEEALKAYS